jgi:hypothetical protein
VRVVMSSAAWHDYDVPASPYFVHIDGNGELAGEGTAQRFEQVISLFTDAVTDAVAQGGSADRALRAERELESAGIGPGHPSLYAGRARAGDDAG